MGWPFSFQIVARRLSLELFTQVQYARRCNEDGAVRSNHYTDHQGKYKAFDVVTAQQEDGEQHDKRRERCIDGTAERAVQSIVHEVRILFLIAIQSDVFTNTVKHNHRIVDGITDDCQNRCDERLVDFHREGQDACKDAECSSIR